jgi:hypothetical protein
MKAHNVQPNVTSYFLALLLAFRENNKEEELKYVREGLALAQTNRNFLNISLKFAIKHNDMELIKAIYSRIRDTELLNWETLQAVVQVFRDPEVPEEEFEAFFNSALKPLEYELSRLDRNRLIPPYPILIEALLFFTFKLLEISATRNRELFEKLVPITKNVLTEGISTAILHGYSLFNDPKKVVQVMQEMLVRTLHLIQRFRHKNTQFHKRL